ncbi:sensor domain-containing diguanylate cyclase [soil metagenome]
MIAPLPSNEKERLKALSELQILDTPAEHEFDDVVMLASQVCGTPIAAISLIDESRQWFKARVGLDASETSRDVAFCAHTIIDPTMTMVVNDATQDERFAANPLVTGELGIRFYAGAPLVTRDNFALGSLCVIDREPRQLDPDQIASLEALARQLTLRLELRRATNLLEKANEDLKHLSLTDELTGLYNQRGFYFHAEQQIKLFRSRESERSLWVIFGDMDGLKLINDIYGHLEGSAAIRATADILMRTLRDADIIGRIGGDEFVALLPNTQDEVAKKLPARLEANLAEHNASSGKPYVLDISIGMARVAYADKTSIADVVKIADAKMYENKRAKKELQVRS